MSYWDESSDEELLEAGMYRCACGVAIYPDGDPTPHCEAEAQKRGATTWRSPTH